MIRLIYFSTILLFGFTACCKKGKVAEKTKTEATQEMTDKKELTMTQAEKEAAIALQMKEEQPPNEANDYYQMVSKEIPENAFARIQKTACFGRCPIYTMTVFDDGRVEYYGRKFVEKEGRHFAKATPKMLSDLLAKAKEINFFELDNIYDKQGITDLPSVIITIKNEEGFKTVVNRYNGPQELIKLETFFEDSFERLEYSSPD